MSSRAIRTSRQRHTHQQSIFGWPSVVILAMSVSLEPAVPIETLRRVIARANFQPCDRGASLSSLFQSRPQQRGSDVPSAELRPHSHIVDVQLVTHHPSHYETCDSNSMKS